MDEKHQKFIENTLGQLDKSTTWVFITLMVIILSNSGSTEYEFGSIKIKKGQSGLVFYLILCGLNFQVLKLLQLLNSSFMALKEKSAGITILQNDTWLFNPFSKTTGAVGFFTDNVAVALLVILWWLGFALANREISKMKTNYILSMIFMILFFGYLFLGILSLVLIVALLSEIGAGIEKFWFLISGMVVGALLFYIIEKKDKFLKAIFTDDERRRAQ